MDYFNKNREELIDICKKKGIKGYSRKNKRQLIDPTQCIEPQRRKKKILS